MKKINSEIEKYLISGMVFILCAFTFPKPMFAQPTSTSARLGIFITGLSGSDAFKNYFERAPKKIRTVLIQSGYQESDFVLFSEHPEKSSNWHRSGVSSRGNVLRFLTDLKKSGQVYSEVFIFVAGHANGRDESAHLHVPGRDIEYAPLIKKIDSISAKKMIVVVAAPQGEAWIHQLSRPGRIIIVGNGYRQYDFIPQQFLWMFPEVFQKVGMNPIPNHSSSKKNPGSLFDVFFETQQKVSEWYQANHLRLTEMALLDGDGDKKGTSFFKNGSLMAKEIALEESSDARAAALKNFSLGHKED